MAVIRSVDVIAQKWATVTPQRSGDYEAGVKSPRAPWLRQTLAAIDSWAAGIQAAIASKSWSKAVAKAGDAAWLEGATVKGVARWGPGVAVSVAKYQAGFAPYQAAIARVQLPPRYARRDPRNLARVTAIVEALVKAKAGTGG